MKKIAIVSILSFLFLICSSIVAYYLRYTSYSSPWVYLVIGVVLLIISGIICIFSRQNVAFNLICFIISSIALGFCIKSWYVYRNFDNELITMFFVSLASIVYLWIFYFLLYIPFFEKYLNVFIWVFLGLSFIIYLVVILTTKTTFVSTFGFYMIVEIAFIFALCKKVDGIKQLFKNMVISTYSVFVVAIFIALAMISEGDLDLDFSSNADIEITSPKEEKVKNDLLMNDEFDDYL